MNLFVIMMLLNMALVWLMMYFSICLMIIISICSMIIVLEWYFEITFISRKKGLCWPSVWDYLLFDIRSAQSAKWFLCSSVWDDWWLSFANEEGKIFVHKIIFVKRWRDILLTKCTFCIFLYRKTACIIKMQTEK